MRDNQFPNGEQIDDVILPDEEGFDELFSDAEEDVLLNGEYSQEM